MKDGMGKGKEEEKEYTFCRGQHVRRGLGLGKREGDGLQTMHMPAHAGPAPLGP